MTKGFFLVIVFLTLSIVSCSQPEPEALPPAEILANSAERMNGLPGFFFIIDRSGGPAYLDSEETISFRRAEGYYVAPDRAQATVRVIAPGIVTDVNMIGIGDIQWQTNLLSTEWTELPPNWGFNPAVLFDSEIGIQSILAADVSDLKLEGFEKIEGGPDSLLYVVSGILDGGKIYEMTYRLIGPETMPVRLWIAPETFELVQAEITEPATGGEEATVWQVNFSEFGTTVNIVPPNS